VEPRASNVKAVLRDAFCIFVKIGKSACNFPRLVNPTLDFLFIVSAISEWDALRLSLLFKHRRLPSLGRS